jgi:hypothetical protein
MCRRTDVGACGTYSEGEVMKHILVLKHWVKGGSLYVCVGCLLWFEVLRVVTTCTQVIFFWDVMLHPSSNTSEVDIIPATVIYLEISSVCTYLPWYNIMA